MKVGTALPQRRTDRAFLDVARECADLGYDSVFAFDHLIPLGGTQGTMLDAFTALGAVAAVTPLRVVTLVARVTMRPPPMTVHLARTLYAIAGERAVLGLGLGDGSSAREDELLGLPHVEPAERRHVLRRTVAMLREAVPAVPLWLGGTGARTQALAKEVADGWNAWAATAAEIAAADMPPSLTVSWGGQVVLGATREEAAERLASWSPGRDPSERDRAIHGTPDDVAEGLRTLASAGVAECFVSFVGGDAAEQRRTFAREVRPLL